MKTYGYVSHGTLQEIITPAVYPDEHPDWVEGQPTRTGLEIPIEERRTAELVSMMADITDLDPMPDMNWLYANGVFSAPPIPGTSPAEILASQSAKLQGLKTLAEAQKSAITARIGVLNEAIQYEIATPDEVAELPVLSEQRVQWGEYAVYLGRVAGQETWPANVSWPDQPVEWIDLATSSAS